MPHNRVSYPEYPTPYRQTSFFECPTPYKCALLHIDTILSPSLYKNPIPVGAPWKSLRGRKETRIKMEIVEVLQQAITVERDWHAEILGFEFVFVARITLTLISSFAITNCFKKSIFRDLT